MPKPGKWIFASLLCSLSWSVPAQVDTSVQYNGWRYELLDLDPDDGIAPWATFELVDVLGTATVFDTRGTVLDDCTVAATGSCTAAMASGQAMAWFDGTGSGGRAVWNTGEYGGAYGGANVTTRATFSYSFSPRTQATFFADLSIRKDEAAPADSTGGTFHFVRYRFGEPPEDEGFFGIDEERPGDWLSTFTLVSRDQAMYGEILAYTSAASVHFPPPIPEPSAWALLAGGLVYLGAACRSRRANRHRMAPRSGITP